MVRVAGSGRRIGELSRFLAFAAAIRPGIEAIGEETGTAMMSGLDPISEIG